MKVVEAPGYGVLGNYVTLRMELLDNGIKLQRTDGGGCEDKLVRLTREGLIMIGLDRMRLSIRYCLDIIIFTAKEI